MTSALPDIAQPNQADVRTLDIARPTVLKAKKKKVAKEERIPVYERVYKGSYTQVRPGLAEGYEGTKSGRESWWRTYIRETPLPGSYLTESDDTFILDLEKSINTYSFKSDGRRIEAQRDGKGADLLPGAYQHKDMIEEMGAKIPQRTYTFKSRGRIGKDLLNEGLKDKHINVAPNRYSAEKYLALQPTDPDNKNYTFKSTLKRFPTIHFVPKEGPAPGAYDSKQIMKSPTISSSFKSATPRFHTSHTKVPGPGMYEPMFQTPQTKSVRNMGRLHGLFFTCSFQK